MGGVARGAWVPTSAQMGRLAQMEFILKDDFR